MKALRCRGDASLGEEHVQSGEEIPVHFLRHTQEFIANKSLDDK
jgi:hypothetical protein